VQNILAQFIIASAFALSTTATGGDATLPAGARVNVVKAVPRGTTERPIIDLRLSYAFPQRSNVWLQGIGTVPASGELSYTLRLADVVFAESEKGKILASVPVKPTEIQQTPALGDPYASTSLDAGWLLDGEPITAAIETKGAWNFIERSLRDVYNGYTGPTPCRPDDQGCLLTQWTSITKPMEWLQGEMAVMVTYAKLSNKPPTTSLKVYYLLRQAPIGQKGHWDYKVDPEIRKIALNKIVALRTRLSGSQRSK
jgi:hypothetical protein